MASGGATPRGGGSPPFYNMYIFNRNGVCLHYAEWHRPRRPDGSMADDEKNMFGLLFTLKTFASAMDPKTENKALGAALAPGEGCSFHAFRTDTYKLHLLETLSGIKIVVNTDPGMGDLREALRHIYGGIYVEYVMKNPLYRPGEKFESELFTQHLNTYMRSIAGGGG